MKLSAQKTRVIGLPYGENFMTLSSTIS